MGIFTFFFSTKLYSTRELPLTKDEIKKIVSPVKVKTLKHGEELLVEAEIDKRRRKDGKISLQQIYEVLRRLEISYQISKYDKKALMHLFKEHFSVNKE